MASVTENVPNWEMSKENTMPIKRGRNPNKAKPALGLRELQNRSDEVSTRINDFEDALRKEPGSLSVWIKYIKWMQDRFPNGSKELLPLFERCTREFSKNPAYKNDERYIKIWIGYADMLPNPSEVFKYMRTEGIGEGLALYYVATAWTAERRKDFSLADKAYKVGLEKKAKPVDMLRKRHREFQRRMSRYLLNQVEQQELQAEVQLDENNQPLKPSRANRSLNSQGNTGVSAARKPAPQLPPNQFNVFVENNAEFKANNWEHTGKSKKLSAQAVSTKENTRKPTPWVNQGLPSHGAVSGKPAPPKSFGVFVDKETPECQGSRRKQSSDTRGLHERATQGKSKPKLTEAEQLRKHPMRNFKKEAKAVEAKAKTPCKKEERIQKLGNADEQDLTINTKLAFEDMFEMFASPSMKEEEKKPLAAQNGAKSVKTSRPTKKSSSKKSRPFSVFETEKSPAHAKMKNSKPFAVFSEDSSSAPQPVATASGRTKSAAPFAIHEDFASNSKPQTRSPARSEAKVPFCIHQDVDPSAESSVPSDRKAKATLPFTIHKDEEIKAVADKSSNCSAVVATSSLPKQDGFSIFLDSKESTSVQLPTTTHLPSTKLVKEPSENQENENLPQHAKFSKHLDPSRALKTLETHEENTPEGFSDDISPIGAEDIFVYADSTNCEKQGLSKGFAAFDDDDDLCALPIR